MNFSKSGQADATKLWAMIDTLEKLLSPDFSNKLKLTEDSKSELLLNYTSQLETFSKDIEELKHLKDYLNTTEFQGLDSHEKKLAAIARVHAQQEVELEELSKKVHDLMQTYSRVMLQLSAQCVEWGRTLNQLESK